MKKITLIILALPCLLFAQKDPCSKYLKKVKDSYTSSAFAEQKMIQSDPFTLADAGKRNLYIQFKKTDTTYITIRQQSTGPSQFVLGTEAKIAFLFEDNNTYVLSFSSSENTNYAGEFNMSSNEEKIEPKFNDLLKSKKIIKVEILNAFGRVNQGKVFKTQVFNGEKIMNAYNCVLSK